MDLKYNYAFFVGRVGVTDSKVYDFLKFRLSIYSISGRVVVRKYTDGFLFQVAMPVHQLKQVLKDSPYELFVFYKLQDSVGFVRWYVEHLANRKYQMLLELNEDRVVKFVRGSLYGKRSIDRTLDRELRNYTETESVSGLLQEGVYNESVSDLTVVEVLMRNLVKTDFIREGELEALESSQALLKKLQTKERSVESGT